MYIFENVIQDWQVRDLAERHGLNYLISEKEASPFRKTGKKYYLGCESEQEDVVLKFSVSISQKRGVFEQNDLIGYAFQFDFFENGEAMEDNVSKERIDSFFNEKREEIKNFYEELEKTVDYNLERKEIELDKAPQNSKIMSYLYGRKTKEREALESVSSLFKKLWADLEIPTRRLEPIRHSAFDFDHHRSRIHDVIGLGDFFTFIDDRLTSGVSLRPKTKATLLTKEWKERTYEEMLKATISRKPWLDKEERFYCQEEAKPVEFQFNCYVPKIDLEKKNYREQVRKARLI